MKKVLPLLLIPGLILVVVVIHVLLADGAASAKHERAATTIVSVQEPAVAPLDGCDGPCGGDSAIDLVACTLALLTGLVFLAPLAVFLWQQRPLSATLLAPPTLRRARPAPRLHELSVIRA